MVKPSKGKLIKFDLMFLFKIHRGWKSRTCKLVPKLERGPKDVSFSLEGKDIVDLVCKAETMEDAIYDCEEMCMCFELIQREMNSKDSVYRDAAGNRDGEPIGLRDLRPVHRGARSVGVVSEDVDRLVDPLPEHGGCGRGGR